MSRSDRPLALCAALCLLTPLACEPEPEPPWTDTTLDTSGLLPFACELGQPDAARAFTALTDAPELELMLGFQGFLIVELIVRTDDPLVASGASHANVTVGEDAPFDAVMGQLTFGPATDGARDTQAFPLVLQSSAVGDYRDREARLVVRVATATQVCTARATVRLVDHDTCVHTGTSIECPAAPSSER